MQLKFKTQSYQTDAVEAVVDCFAGQPNATGLAYRLDPGRDRNLLELSGFANPALQLGETQLLENIRAVQRRRPNNRA